MDFAKLPPEINSGRMYAGPGSGPMLAAAAAWDGLAGDLHSAATSCGSVTSGLVAGPWLPASAAMAAAVSPYLAWMSLTATQAEQAAMHAKAAAAAYEVAFAATLAPPVIAANRALLTALVATNIFGQNTAAIAATEADYAEMWGQDAAAMYGYAAASASAAMLTPFTSPPQSANPGGLAGQAAALAHGAGASTAAQTQTMLSQLTSALPAALHGLASPTTSATGVSAIPPSLAAILQALGMSLLSASTILEPAALGLGSSELSTASGAWMASAQGDQEILEDTTQLSGMEDRIMFRFNQLGAERPPVSAGIGEGASVGALSVPAAWTTAAPAIRLTAVALPSLPTTSVGAAPEVTAASPGSLLSQMALAGMARRTMRGPVIPGGREQIGASTRARSLPFPATPGASTTGITEIREITELLGKLGALRESGVLTPEEFKEQKRRLLAAAPAPA